MQKLLAFVENNLLLLAVLAAAFGLLVPSVGIALSGSIGPLLAALMLVISLTFDAHAVKLVLRKPDRQLWALGLVYGPMSLAGWLIGRVFFGSGHLAAGQTLVGTLPTDVSAPLLVLLAKGSVALAAVLNAVNTALSPFIVPFLFLLLTGIELQVPVGSVVLELILVVLVPTVVGVYLRTRFAAAVSRHDSAYPAIDILSAVAAGRRRAQRRCDSRLWLVRRGHRLCRPAAEPRRICGRLSRKGLCGGPRRGHHLPLHGQQKGVQHRCGVRGSVRLADRDRRPGCVLRCYPDDHLADRRQVAGVRHPGPRIGGLDLKKRYQRGLQQRPGQGHKCQTCCCQQHTNRGTRCPFPRAVGLHCYDCPASKEENYGQARNPAMHGLHPGDKPGSAAEGDCR